MILTKITTLEFSVLTPVKASPELKLTHIRDTAKLRG